MRRKAAGKNFGFIMVELLVASLLLAAVFGGVLEVVGIAVECARVVRERRSDAVAFSALASEVRADAAEKNFDDGRRRVRISGGDAPLSPQDVQFEAAAFGAAGEVRMSWTRRRIEPRE